MKKNLLIISILLLSCNYYAFSQDIDTNDYNLIVQKIDSCFSVNKSYNYKQESNSKEYTDWEDGTIILNDNSTLTGTLKIKKGPIDEVKPIRIEFKQKNSEKIDTYRADKIKGFYKGGSVYYSKKVSDMPPAYIELLDSGRINLFIFKCYDLQPNKTLKYTIHYYIEKEGFALVELPSEKLQKRFIEYFNDCPIILEFLSSDLYQKDRFRELIQTYNEIVK